MIRPKRHRLTSAQREELWDREAAKASAAGRGSHPICNLCDCPIFIGRDWHESHNKFLPHAIGGEPDGIAHDLCNRRHNNEFDTPLVAKVKRIRWKHIGAQLQSRNPIPGGRHDRLKRKIDGTVVER